MQKKRIVCFGEILLRMSAPGAELLLQTPKLDVHVGGAEANVAVLLARLGNKTDMVSMLPDNRLGQAAFEELRRYGVGTDQINFGPGRMGLYFLSPGAVLRPSEITYDRAGSSFALADPGVFDWSDILPDSAFLHISGVTPAVGPNGAAAAVRAVQAAWSQNIPVSFDGNYRAKLWAAWSGDGPQILRSLFECSSVAFADDRDISLVLGEKFDDLDPESRRLRAAAAAFSAFPKLNHIASTIRIQHGVDHHEISGMMISRSGIFRTSSYSLSGIIDRIGAGDAFAGGILHGLVNGFDNQRALEFGVAATCLKHAIPGDFCLTSIEELNARAAGEGLDVRR